jgi:hypothetical protein
MDNEMRDNDLHTHILDVANHPLITLSEHADGVRAGEPTVAGHAHPITLAATIADEFRDQMALGGS